MGRGWQAAWGLAKAKLLLGSLIIVPIDRYQVDTTSATTMMEGSIRRGGGIEERKGDGRWLFDRSSGCVARHAIARRRQRTMAKGMIRKDSSPLSEVLGLRGRSQGFGNADRDFATGGISPRGCEECGFRRNAPPTCSRCHDTVSPGSILITEQTLQHLRCVLHLVFPPK